jgi:eukaryotic-like serine/threonine-protein kinase
VVGRLTYVRDGAEVGTIGPLAAYGDLRISPDQRRIAVGRHDHGSSVWVVDAERGAMSRISFQEWAGMPVWMPDSRGVVFAAAEDMPPDIFLWRDGAVTRLTRSPLQYYPTDVTPDGKLVIAMMFDPETEMDIYAVPVDPPHTPRPLVRTKFRELSGRVSPDGRWLAYTSNESGVSQIYAIPLSGGPRVQISLEGGWGTRWSADGRTLYYVDSAQNQFMAVPITVAGDELRPGTAKALGPAAGSAFDVTRDGRILVSREELNRDSPPLTVVTNWMPDLR